MSFLPPTILIYGRSGLHKTGSVYKALGPFAFWQAFERNALAPATLPWLQEEWKTAVPDRSPIPDHDYCLDVNDPIKEAHATIDRMMPQIRAGAYRAWVLDTATTLAQRCLQALHKKGIKDDYGRAASMVNEQILTVIHRLLQLDLMVIAIAHERTPSQIEGKFTPGGPELYGKGVSLLPAQFDVVLHAVVDMTPAGKLVVGVADELDTQWISKDRWGISGAEKKLDLNLLRPALKAALAAAKSQ